MIAFLGHNGASLYSTHFAKNTITFFSLNDRQPFLRNIAKTIVPYLKIIMYILRRQHICTLLAVNYIFGILERANNKIAFKKPTIREIRIGINYVTFFVQIHMISMVIPLHKI
jgi:hypothetical protein